MEQKISKYILVYLEKTADSSAKYTKPKDDYQPNLLMLWLCLFVFLPGAFCAMFVLAFIFFA